MKLEPTTQRAYVDMGYEKEEEIAKKLLKKNMDISEIQEITGLSLEEIKKLSQNNTANN